MGFKKCEPHKKYSEKWNDPYKMISDTHEMKHQTVNGKRVFIQVKKEHPKWRMFYKLIFNEAINIWIDTDKGQRVYPLPAGARFIENTEGYFDLPFQVIKREDGTLKFQYR